uniref:Protein kinase domain-containing protein n=1 Tax=Picea sitchensis TaxID=3332 RepID=A9NQA1_PICSI|nr:unknown [Picea sitchensis]
MHRAMTDALLRNYQLQDEVIGRGRFGVIRRCFSKRSGQQAACKTIRKSDLLHDSIDRDCLRNEIKIMQYVAGHPAVVALHEACEDDEYVHLVMDMCSGGDLFDRIVSRKNTVPFSEEEAATILKKLMEAISYCHSMGIAHRDIKPDNILFADNSNSLAQIKLADFGQASFFSPGQGLMQGIVGTPYYVAPEVLGGKEYSEKVDVWSAGVILYIMLSGVAPFLGNTPQEIFEAVLRGRLRFPSDPWLSISHSAKDLIRRMLCRDVTRRLSAQQVLEHGWISAHTYANPSSD